MDRQLADNEAGKKNKQKFKKKSAEQRKILLIFSVFYGKKAKKSTFFEVFSRNFNVDKSDNQA